MHFGFTKDELDWRQEVREVIRTVADVEWMNHWTTSYESAGSSTGVAWRKALGGRGWLSLGWPAEYGGIDKTFVEQWILIDEIGRAGLPKLGIAPTMIAPTLIRVGSEEMKRQWLPRIARGQVEFALGYSEADSGTDLANLRTKAIRDGAEFVINGTKLWNSGAHVATHEWLAARTDPAAPRHAGISIIIVPIEAPGIEIRPIYTWGGHRTNEVTFTNVRVPVDNLVGEMNSGWSYLTHALGSERLVVGESGDLQRALTMLIHHANTATRRGRPLSEDPHFIEFIGTVDTDINVARLLSLQCARLMDQEKDPGVAASMVKVWATELRRRFGNEGGRLLGLNGLVQRDDAHAPVFGQIEHHFRDSVRLGFTAGANEVQRDIIARRGLGLPRAGSVAPAPMAIADVTSLDLSELQHDLVLVARRFRKGHGGAEMARRVAASETGHESELWSVMAASGWLGMALPEEVGGGGAALVDLAVVTEELARALVPATFRSTAIAAHTVASAPEGELRSTILEGVCEGRELLTVAFAELGGIDDPLGMTTVAACEGERWRINGAKLFVAEPDSATRLILISSIADPLATEPEVGVFVLDAVRQGITHTRTAVTGTGRFGRVDLQDVIVDRSALIARGPAAIHAIAESVRWSLALDMADAVGVGQEIVELTADYMRTRVVFGKPLGSFQAVQHHCANMLMDLSAARALTYEAIAALSEGQDAEPALLRAGGFTPEAVTRIALTAHQLHAAIGYSTEYQLHLYTDRARVTDLAHATSHDFRAELAGRLGLRVGQALGPSLVAARDTTRSRT
jgi:alkylation response protein AidB-like acyl-CoA dehydrogenase